METKNTLVIGLANPKSPTNVGAVMRAAGCYGVDSIIYTGERFNRAIKYQTDTKNVESKISLRHVDDLLSDVPKGMSIVCVELVEGAQALPTFEHPEHAIYLFGPEDGSLSQTLINQAKHVVYVPTIGCMNLAATVNVLLYDRMAKSGVSYDDDETIKSSRDNNNRLVFQRQRD